jgi:hypothetical protein
MDPFAGRGNGYSRINSSQMRGCSIEKLLSIFELFLDCKYNQKECLRSVRKARENDRMPGVSPCGHTKLSCIQVYDLVKAITIASNILKDDD